MSEDNTLHESELNSSVWYIFIILTPVFYDLAAAYVAYLFIDNIDIFESISLGILLGIVVYYVFVARHEIRNLENILHEETGIDYNRVEKKHVTKYLYDWMVDIDKVPYIFLHIIVFTILSVFMDYVNASSMAELVTLVVISALFVFISNLTSGPIKYARDKIDIYVDARDLIAIKHGKK